MTTIGKYRAKGKKMMGQFSWTFDTGCLNKKKALISSHYRVPNLPKFKFTFVVLESRPQGGIRRMNLEILKKSSKTLYCDLTIYLSIGKSVISHFEFPWHEWGDGACTWPNALVHNIKFITLKCEIAWIRPRIAPLVYSPSNLHNICKPFLLQSSFSDVKIIIDKEELPAHKLILVAHSSVFKAMLECDMKEGRENEIIIEDITSDVMKHVLAFLYTGCDEPLDDSEMALEMLFVAEKYDIKDLKHCCEYKLHQQLKLSNVLEFLESSDLNNAEDLKAQCLDFMVENKLAVLKDSEFKSVCLRKPNLMYGFMKIAVTH